MGMATPAPNMMGGVFDDLNDVKFVPSPRHNKEAQSTAPTTNVEQVKQFFEDESQIEKEKFAAADKHDWKLKNWMGTPVRHNVKVLLCTLPDILWPDNGWERVAMDKLMEPKDVKKVHRQYIVKFHPDKVMTTGDQDKIFIANTAFAAINEALMEYKVSELFQVNTADDIERERNKMKRKMCVGVNS